MSIWKWIIKIAGFDRLINTVSHPWGNGLIKKTHKIIRMAIIALQRNMALSSANCTPEFT